MTFLSEKKCPSCQVTLGVMFTEEGKRATTITKPTYTACVVCGAMLQVHALVEGRPTVSKLSDEQVLALPDEERIQLIRVRKSTEHIDPKVLREVIERSEVTRDLWDRYADEITTMLDEKLTAIFGPKVGAVLIIKDIHPYGFQAMVENLPTGMSEQVLKRALIDAEGRMGEVIKELMGRKR